jgi:hypothetical protein
MLPSKFLHKMKLIKSSQKTNNIFKEIKMFKNDTINEGKNMMRDLSDAVGKNFRKQLKRDAIDEAKNMFHDFKSNFSYLFLLYNKINNMNHHIYF